MTELPVVSVICNTLNRADALAQLLAALRQLTYPSFEVVVVAGPCTDHTMDVLEPYRDQIKVRRCPEPNLSMSRNIGINAAAGEIVAFVDDDGIPEPTWLDEIVAAYDSDEVAAVGGVVRNHTGYSFQCRFNRADRIGNADSTSELPLDQLSFPGSWEIPYVIGTNSSFRRDRLVAVGGFDEEFEFYLDETDVCVRLVDKGWMIRQLPGAEVHHKFLPSAVRNEERVTVDQFAVVKNRIYFSLLHAHGDVSMARIMASHAEWVEERIDDIDAHFAAGRVSEADLNFAKARIEAGWQAGLEAGFRGRRTMIDPVVAASPDPFLPYATLRPAGRRLRIAMVTQFLPPDETGGTGRYLLDTARELARLGHEVRIITSGQSHDTVDLEDGVWIHRLIKDRPQAPSTVHPFVPDRIWRNAGAVADEVIRLHEQRPIDVVLGVMWDVETIAVVERTNLPVVTTLVTTLGITFRTRPEWENDEEFMANFGRSVLDLERWLIEGSHQLHAISHAILDEAVEVAGAKVDPAEVVVAPLGVVDRPTAAGIDRDGCTVLFVGRFEKRKGIDLLLAAVPPLLERHDDLRVVLVGRNDLPGEDGVTYVESFDAVYRSAPWRDRVEFRGMVGDDDLWAAYAECDVFVAPSRFESFGLIYVEAMMARRPVVALRLGSAPEVIEHESTGLLVGPDAVELEEALGSLIDDAALRERMGEAGRARYEERFTSEAMGASMERLLLTVVEAHS